MDNGNGNQQTNAESNASSNEVLRVAAIAELRSLANQVFMDRIQYMRQAGFQFEGRRDLYEILGYARVITTKDYRDRYERGGIAGRIVDAMPNATWRGMPAFEIIEDDDPDKITPFEQAWIDLDRRLQIQAKLLRVDKLAGLSTYAVLLIGAAGELDTPLPRGKNSNQLLYLTPFGGGGGPGGRNSQTTVAADADAQVMTFDENPQSKRFGLPLTYQLKRIDISMTLQRPVHWTRVLHVAENLMADEVYGLPTLERVWNLLDDLEKVTGGGAEAFWLRANQGLHLDIDKDMSLPDATAAIAALKEQAENYKHQMTRWLRTRGVKVETLGSDVANFGNPADAVLTQIAGAKSIPKRILTGSEMGELASSQDRDNWRDQIVGRQTQYAGPYIVRPLIDRLIEYGYLPAPAKGQDQYEVRWPHLQTLTEQERTAGAQAWAQVNQTFGDLVFTEAEIRDKWHGMAPLTEEQREEADERAMDKAKRAQEVMKLQQPAEIPVEDEDDDEEIEDEEPRAAEDRKYSSTEVRLPPDIANKLLAFGSAIPFDDLAEDGCERIPHVTVKYGLHTLDVGEVRSAMAEFTGPIHLTLGKTAVFEAEKYDVVYVTVKSPDLKRLNKLLSQKLAVTDTHPEYIPHATIAYVKKGMGAKYKGKDVAAGMEATLDTVVFGPSSGLEVTADQVIVIPPTPISVAQRIAQMADTELVTVLAAAIEHENVEVVHAIIGLHSDGSGGKNSGKIRNDKVDKILNDPSVLKHLKIPPTMYHVTSANNAQQILKKGLAPGSKRSSTLGESRGVYITQDPHDIWKEGGDITGDTILEVKTSGLDLRLDPEYFYYDDISKESVMEYIQAVNDGEENFALYSRKAIPSKNIKLY